MIGGATLTTARQTTWLVVNLGERARAATLYGQGFPQKEILEEIGINRRTLLEWRTTDEEFQRAVTSIRRARDQSSVASRRAGYQHLRLGVSGALVFTLEGRSSA